MGNEIQEVRRVLEDQLEQTYKIIASEEAIADIISEVDNTLVSGFSMLGAGLQELCFITEDGLREVCDRLDLQNKTLEAIKEILEKPLDTQAKELRKRAEEAYLNNWIEEAETDLLEAEKKNYQDFIVHQILGNIYYHHKGNYEKALEYYEKAAKYAIPRSQKHAGNALLCAAMVHYKRGELHDAYKSTKTAIELSLNDSHVLSQVLYNHAGYAAKTGYVEEAIDFLKKSVLIDPMYLITADRDERFSYDKAKVRELDEHLRNEKKKIVDELLEAIKSAAKEAESVGICLSLETQLAGITELYTRNSYLDLLKAEQVALRIYGENVSAWIKIKDKELSGLRTRENEIKNKTYAGWGFLPTVLLWILA
jgi:tetratricopeptide (TPR) repeat protein